MSCMTRCVLRYGVLAALALGGVTLLVGPERVAAGLAQVRGKAQNLIDGCIDDPMALRRQLRQLADQYPDRIAEVRGEIAEVNHQLEQFSRDMEISKRVVAMTTEDLSELKTLVARAEAELAATARPVALRFEGVRYDIEEAYAEGRRINNVRGTYQDRLAHDKVQHDFLKEQAGRLTSILEKLESEYATYQAQLWQLDREIDAIERNDRLIELAEQQQATLESYERFGKVGNLRQLEAELRKIREIQLAQLETLERANISTNYEDQARYEIDTDNLAPTDPFTDVFEDEGASQVETRADDSVVWNGPKVIE